MQKTRHESNAIKYEAAALIGFLSTVMLSVGTMLGTILQGRSCLEGFGSGLVVAIFGAIAINGLNNGASDERKLNDQLHAKFCRR